MTGAACQKNADCPFITNFNLFANTVSDIYRIFAKRKLPYETLVGLNLINMTKKLSLLAIILWATLSLQARKWTPAEVRDVIRKVNTYWQQNNKAEVRSFWDNAAYHTGNMEVYKLLKDKQMLDYSIRWAEHNQWMGATEADPAKWKYKRYGEGQDYVIFGDWQICFQTYIDLYVLLGDESKIKRAMEVMGYEADSKANDYWWWADALYMVMPVMTKMYR